MATKEHVIDMVHGTISSSYLTHLFLGPIHITALMPECYEYVVIKGTEETCNNFAILSHSEFVIVRYVPYNNTYFSLHHLILRWR